MILVTVFYNCNGLSKAAKLVTCYQFPRGKDKIDW